MSPKGAIPSCKKEPQRGDFLLQEAPKGQLPLARSSTEATVLVEHPLSRHAKCSWFHDGTATGHDIIYDGYGDSITSLNMHRGKHAAAAIGYPCSKELYVMCMFSKAVHSLLSCLDCFFAAYLS